MFEAVLYTYNATLKPILWCIEVRIPILEKPPLHIKLVVAKCVTRKCDADLARFSLREFGHVFLFFFHWIKNLSFFILILNRAGLDFSLNYFAYILHARRGTKNIYPHDEANSLFLSFRSVRSDSSVSPLYTYILKCKKNRHQREKKKKPADGSSEKLGADFRLAEWNVYISRCIRLIQLSGYLGLVIIFMSGDFLSLLPLFTV